MPGDVLVARKLHLTRVSFHAALRCQHLTRRLSSSRLSAIAQPSRALKRFSSLRGLPAVVVPVTVTTCQPHQPTISSPPSAQWSGVLVAYHDCCGRQDVIQVYESQVHLVAYALDYTSIVDRVVHQGLQLWKLEPILVPNEVVHNGNLIVNVDCQAVALHQQPASCRVCVPRQMSLSGYAGWSAGAWEGAVLVCGVILQRNLRPLCSRINATLCLSCIDCHSHPLQHASWT